RVEGLHAATEELGRPGQLLDGRHAHAGIAQERRRPGRGYDRAAQLRQAGGKRRQAVLVADRDEGPLDAHEGVPNSRTACGSSRCSTSWMARLSFNALPFYRNK